MAITLDRNIKFLALKYGGWILCLAMFSYFIFQSVQAGGNDFSNSYFGASFFLQGEFDLGIFDPYTFNQKIYDEGYRNLFVNYNPNPPSTAIFFVPFALLPLGFAKVLFNIVTSVLFLFSTNRLCRHLSINQSVIMLCIPVVFFIPIRNQILFGQTYFLIFALIVEGFLAHEKKKMLLASFLWSFAIFTKVFPVILILFLILKKDWRQVSYLSATCLLILIICVGLQGIDVWKEYVFIVLPRNNQGEIHSPYLATYQSALMLFKYLFVGESTLNPKPFIDSLILFKTSLILFKVAVLGICSLIVMYRKDVLSFGLVLLCGILVSPYGSTYSNILLLMLLIAIQKENNGAIFWTSAFLIFLIGNIPTGMFEQLPIVLRFPRLILMCTLFGLLFWASKAEIDVKVFLFYIILLGIPALVQSNKSKDPSKLLLSENTHNLIFDYGIYNGVIFYKYWYDGPENFYTDIVAAELKTGSVSIKENQIFYRGKQLTSSPDNKLKASIVNGDSIIYLSDKGKGIGFYAIRVISLDN